MTHITPDTTEDLESLFNKTFDKIPNDKTIDISQRWYRQHFRLSGATSPFNYGLKLQVGEILKGVDVYKRRVIFIGSPHGTVVLYKESVKESRKPYFTYDTPANFRHARASKLNTSLFKNFIQHAFH